MQNAVKNSSVWLMLFMSAAIAVGLIPSAMAASIQNGVLLEDFSELTYWDATQSTGLWNLVEKAAQSGRVTGGVALQKIDFGDGSDGVLDTASGYTFDTNSHPNGFNFVSVNISGGTIQVTGTNPLVIRSLSTITLVPTLSVRGGNGTDGVVNGTLTGSPGGIAVASLCSGGKGGDAANTPTGDGSDGMTYNGTTESAGGGEGGSGVTAGADAFGAIDQADPTLSSWETSPNFRCGAGGRGGGGHINGGVYATGGSGGAGGGTLRLIAVGAISYTTLDASGGDGGQGVNDGQCSGGGAGGNSGTIWLQSLSSVTGTTLLTNGGQNGTCAGFLFSGSPSTPRTDTATTSNAGSNTTENSAPSTTYVIQSKSYDLSTLNAGFSEQPTITSTLNGGTITMSYTGSTDGTHFGSPTADITTLSNQNVRYLKFAITIQTASTAGASPQVKSVSIPFSELNIRLSGGCGIVQNKNAKRKAIPFKDIFLNLVPAIAFWIIAWGQLRYKRTQT
jgi:hypothetical protein